MKQSDPAVVIIRECLGIDVGEQLVVVADEITAEIAAFLYQRALEMDMEALFVQMKKRDNDGAEPPGAVTGALAAADAGILVTSRSLSHTEGRRKATACGTRIASMPGLTREMMDRALAGSYEPVVQASLQYARALEGKQIRVSSPAGTDLTFSVEGRSSYRDDGQLTQTGSFGNLPAGEAFISPLEGTARGTLVVDGSMAGIGKIKEPVHIRVEDGLAVEISGGKEASLLREILAKYGKEAGSVAELGIGTNPYAGLTGAVLEDEKVLGTAHVALGDNSSMGGSVKAPSHLDGVMLEPTVVVDGRTILEGGRALLLEKQ